MYAVYSMSGLVTELGTYRGCFGDISVMFQECFRAMIWGRFLNEFGLGLGEDKTLHKSRPEWRPDVMLLLMGLPLG